MLFLTRALLIQFDRSAGAAGFHPLGRPLGQFGGGLDPQLILDVLEVRFDRLDAPMVLNLCRVSPPAIRELRTTTQLQTTKSAFMWPVGDDEPCRVARLLLAGCSPLARLSGAATPCSMTARRGLHEFLVSGLSR